MCGSRASFMLATISLDLSLRSSVGFSSPDSQAVNAAIAASSRIFVYLMVMGMVGKNRESTLVI